MTISIYYTAKRKMTLSSKEVAIITTIVGHYSVDDEIEKLLDGGAGLNWESFDFNVECEPDGLIKKDVVFYGSTKLPDNREDASWVGLQHWCKCLSEIRLAVSGCDWRVTIEDHELPWVTNTNVYDTSG